MSAVAVTPRERRIPGEAGLWVFILGDMTVFALFFGVFLYERQQEAALFAAGREDLTFAFGAANTFVLLTSSLLVALALHAHRRGDARAATRLVAGAGACGLTFVALKAVEWGTVLSDHSDVADNQFFLYFFALTGLHLLHLLLGMAGLALVWRAMRRAGGRLLIEAGCCYWHMVDLLWVVIFPLVYLASA